MDTIDNQPAEGYARAVATTSPHVRDGVLWLTWRGEYILTSSLDFSLPFGHRVAETMAFPSNPTGTILDWGELATVGPHDHAGCIRAAGYEPHLGGSMTRTIDRLAQDVDDLWGTGDTLDLDTPDVAGTPHDARLRMTQRLINDLYEKINHD